MGDGDGLSTLCRGLAHGVAQGTGSHCVAEGPGVKAFKIRISHKHLDKNNN